MASILITGSSGFVGGQCWQAFRDQGWNTCGIGRRVVEDPDYLSIDLSQPLSGEIIRQIRKSDVVLHAAARSMPWGSRKQFYAANVTATENLLKACEENGNPKLIFVSSSSVFYQPQDQFQINESTPFARKPVNHYAATKQIAERLVESYTGNWVTLRPRAVYGVGDTVLFPRILAAAKSNKLPLLTRPGTPAVGDLISGDNLVDCMVQSATNPAITGSFNLTDNEPQEIIEFLFRVFDQLNIPRPSKQLSTKTAFRIARFVELFYGTFLPRKEPPITRFGVHVFAYSKTFDVNKMIRTFGHPKYSVEQSVQKFVRWVKEENPY